MFESWLEPRWSSHGPGEEVEMAAGQTDDVLNVRVCCYGPAGTERHGCVNQGQLESLQRPCRYLFVCRGCPPTLTYKQEVGTFSTEECWKASIGFLVSVVLPEGRKEVAALLDLLHYVSVLIFHRKSAEKWLLKHLNVVNHLYEF